MEMTTSLCVLLLHHVVASSSVTNTTSAFTQIGKDLLKHSLSFMSPIERSRARAVNSEFDQIVVESDWLKRFLTFDKMSSDVKEINDASILDAWSKFSAETRAFIAEQYHQTSLHQNVSSSWDRHSYYWSGCFHHESQLLRTSVFLTIKPRINHQNSSFTEVCQEYVLREMFKNHCRLGRLSYNKIETIFHLFGRSLPHHLVDRVLNTIHETAKADWRLRETSMVLGLEKTMIKMSDDPSKMTAKFWVQKFQSLSYSKGSLGTSSSHSTETPSDLLRSSTFWIKIIYALLAPSIRFVYDYNLLSR